MSACDPSTSVTRVRLLIGDTDATDYIFTNAEVTDLLSMAVNNAFGAAAIGYGIIVRTRALLAKKIVREGYETETHAVNTLLALKKDLEDQANSAAGLQTMEFEITDDFFESWRPEWRDPINTVMIE